MRWSTARAFSPLPQNHDAFHGVVLIRAAGGEPADAAKAELLANLHGAEIADAHGRAVARIHGNVADVIKALHEAQAAHDVEFRAVFNVGAAGVLVAIGQRGENLAERHAVGAQPGGINEHLVLLGGTAEAVDIHDAGHGAELAFHHPVFQRLELHFRITLGGRERVAINLADRGGVGGKAGLRAGRQVHQREQLRGLAADKFVVRAILEHQRDLRQAEQGDRPDGGPVRDAVHLVFNGNGHQALDLFGGVAGKERDDLERDVGDIGISFNGQPQKRKPARDGKEGEQRQHNGAMPQRVGRQGADHELAPSIKDSNSRQPSVTTRWPAERPSRMAVCPRPSAPSCTAWRSNWPGAISTKT